MVTNGATQTQYVYQKLKEKICELDLKPGEPLVENTLAERLAVSRTPVREAFQLLSQERLVHLVPGKGAFVSTVNTQDLVEIFTVREALEGMATKLAASKIPDHILAFLGCKFDQETCNKWELEQSGDTVEELHSLIIKYSSNNLVKDIINN